MTQRRDDRLLDAVAGLSLAAALTAAGTLATGAAVTVAVARAVVTPPRHRRDPVRLHRIDREAGTLTLSRTPESGAAGRYTIVYADGVGRCAIGDIVDETPRTVTRRFGGETGASLDGHRFVRFASAPERTLDDVGVAWRTVEVDTELGPAPAWAFERPGSDDWAIHVHGRGAVLTEPLRSVRLLRDEGWNSLVVAYRNDRVAPRSPDGRFGLGATEWRDVEAAMAWAVRNGARRILLVGWSMGGATVMQALLNSPLADRVVGVVLESPVVSWRATLRMQGRALRLPRWVIGWCERLLASPLARPLVGLDAPIPLDRMELLHRADEIRVPILLFHSTGDTVVPYRPSAALARRLPQLVTYEQFDEALHVRLWNVDRARWERAWREWLEDVIGPGAGGAAAQSSATSRE